MGWGWGLTCGLWGRGGGSRPELQLCVRRFVLCRKHPAGDEDAHAALLLPALGGDDRGPMRGRHAGELDRGRGVRLANNRSRVYAMLLWQPSSSSVSERTEHKPGKGQNNCRGGCDSDSESLSTCIKSDVDKQHASTGSSNAAAMFRRMVGQPGLAIAGHHGRRAQTEDTAARYCGNPSPTRPAPSPASYPHRAIVAMMRATISVLM